MRPLIWLALLASPTAVLAQPAWRGIWEWSCPKRNESDLTRLADSAAGLGFNVLMMSPPPKLIGSMADQCHQRGMRLYYSTVFSGGEKDWQQVLSPTEQARLGQPRRPEYMRGGEPVIDGELFDSALPCYGRPEVHDYFRKRVVANAALPVDGLAFDFVGYQNYYRCYCPACAAKLAEYRRAHPELAETRAATLLAEEMIVDFINDMAGAARRANPRLELAIHIYPWFAPDPYYGHRTEIDYVGQTVSWFFRPHWSLEKVAARTEALVRNQHRVYSRGLAAPFVGFDAGLPRDYRSARRVGRELQIIKASGAQAVQMAELGYLLRKPLVAAAVARELRPPRQ